MVRTMDPTRYWAGIHLTLAYGTGEARRPLTLVLVSDNNFNPAQFTQFVALTIDGPLP